jgi:putative phage-type endonuclease
MKIIAELEQGTEDWLKFRQNHVGASDASTCMGLNPWRTRNQLWEEKVLGWTQELNANMKRGQDLEVFARVEYQQVTNLFVLPMVGESIIHPFISASFDGITTDLRNAVEIKCGKASHKLAEKGEIPVYYMAQLQHQMYVGNLEKIDYFSFDGTNGILIPVKRDDFFIEEMIDKELEFWYCVTHLTPPED